MLGTASRPWRAAGKSLIALDSAGHGRSRAGRCSRHVRGSSVRVAGHRARTGPSTSTLAADRRLAAPCTGTAPDGREVTGWPFVVPVDFACPATDQCSSGTPGLSNRAAPAYLAERSMGMNKRVIAIDVRGEIVPGWPLAVGRLPAGPTCSSAPTGTLVRSPAADRIADVGRLPEAGSTRRLSCGHSARTGNLAPGWPVPVPNIRGFVVGSAGRRRRHGVRSTTSASSAPIRVAPSSRSWHPMGGSPAGMAARIYGICIVSRGRPRRDAVLRVRYAQGLCARQRAVRSGVVGRCRCQGQSADADPGARTWLRDGTIFVVGDEVVALSADGRALVGLALSSGQRRTGALPRFRVLWRPQGDGVCAPMGRSTSWSITRTDLRSGRRSSRSIARVA